MSIRYWLMMFPLIGAGLFAAVASDLPAAGPRARLDVTWMVERGDYTYRLRGGYSIASVTDGFATRVASTANLEPAVSHVYVPTGLYSVTLDAGYTLERLAAHPSEGAPEASDGAFVEILPALLVSPNPLIVEAKEGSIAPIGLSLIDLPGAADDDASTCMNRS